MSTSSPRNDRDVEKVDGYTSGNSFTRHSIQSSIDIETHQSQQHIKTYNSEEDDDVLMLNFNSPIADLSLGKLSPSTSLIFQPPAPSVREQHVDFYNNIRQNNFFGDGTSSYHTGPCMRSCPQTEMERLKARYMKETSSVYNVSHNSSMSSLDGGQVHNLGQHTFFQQPQHFKSLDTDEDEDASLYFDSSFTDTSISKLSPQTCSQCIGQPPMSTSDTFSGMNSLSTYDMRENHSDIGARSCPQTEMERLKAQCMKRASSTYSHNSSLSSIDNGRHQHQQAQQHSLNSQNPHQQQFDQSLQLQPSIRCYDSEDDDDVLMLNFNSPLPDMSLGSLSPPDSQAFHPVLSGGGDLFDTSSTHNQLPYPSVPKSSLYHSGEVLTRSCPQTKMERLTAHCRKERFVLNPFDTNYQTYGSHGGMQSQFFKNKHFTKSKSSYVEQSSPSNILSLSDHSLNRGTKVSDRDHSADTRYSNKKNNSKFSKDNIRPSHSRDYKELSNDLGVLTIDGNMAFSQNAACSERDSVFDIIKQCKAQIVLMSNTGLECEEQLQSVRSEVKVSFPCESAMWAGFLGRCDDDDNNRGASSRKPGRGVVILVLGPLAPRTGWIKSDSNGCAISASARIKPNLPVLTFIACDFIGVSLCEEHPSYHFLVDLIKAEHDKENLVVLGGNLCDGSDSRVDLKTPLTCRLGDHLKGQQINFSFVCDHNLYREKVKQLSDVVVCQRKKSMTILSVDSPDILQSESVKSAPVVLKLNIAGWPKKSFAVQPKMKGQPKLDGNNSPQRPLKSNSRGSSSQVTHQHLLSDLVLWHKNLLDFSHNLQGFLRANMELFVRSNCLRQLLTDILNRVHQDPSKIDCPGYATSTLLNRLSALLSLTEVEFSSRAPIALEQVLSSWLSGASMSLTSPEVSS